MRCRSALMSTITDVGFRSRNRRGGARWRRGQKLRWSMFSGNLWNEKTYFTHVTHVTHLMCKTKPINIGLPNYVLHNIVSCLNFICHLNSRGVSTRSPRWEGQITIDLLDVYLQVLLVAALMTAVLQVLWQRWLEGEGVHGVVVHQLAVVDPQ